VLSHASKQNITCGYKVPGMILFAPHICILRAYWKRSTSRYSPWTAMHLLQQWCHCWNIFKTPIVE